MTLLKDIFAKPVDRDIEGVIKADANNALQTEVQEYVITDELESRLESFLEQYNNYQSANGVWISGFFGSGKSHLLKMLALLLEKRPIDGCEIDAEFLQKCDDVENQLLKGALEKAISIPSESILFNIDQKADVISKTQLDALVAVFVKVFDEHCGYYGKQAWIAQFERRLDEDGLFDDFRESFEQASGQTWEWGRQRINRVSDHVDTAHKQVTGSSKTGVMDAHRADYRLAIEDFAMNVKRYVDRKPKGFRLNFYVDEVGQYIADHVKLMTNLQTIAESLATKCNGQSWIIVTAQGEMDKIVGEMSQRDNKADFSKIMGRFKERMKLSGKNASEVVQKRLLRKKSDFEKEVAAIYDEQADNFKTLLSFGDGAQTYRNYANREHFVTCYPFVPYQFELFQVCIRRLSEQDAFEGKHQSVGERSMLGVFQDVARTIAPLEVGAVATFDMMYEGLRSVLKSRMNAAIGTAERNLDNELAVKILKALFLVKYVREFKASIRNLCVLMLDRFDGDIPQLQKNITEAVNLLESQSYIQRNGDLYEFLTNEEKDVEQEIKNTEVDSQKLTDTLQKMFFDHVLKQRKIRYADNGQDYDFTRKLDDRKYGREHELSINVLTPFHEHSGAPEAVKAISMGRKELLVMMPSDDRLIRDLTIYEQTAKYVRQNQSQNQHESVSLILANKTATNNRREGEIRSAVKELLGQCRMFVGGGEVEHSSEDAQTRLMAGFEQLIDHEYVNLKMLQGIKYTEQMVATILTDSQNTLFETGVGTIREAEEEMLSFIKQQTNRGLRVTIQTVVEKFEKAPNGWYLAATQCILASLCARGKVDARSDGQALTDQALASAIRNTRGHANVILEPQIDIPGPKVRKVKEFYRDFFDEPAPAGEPASLGKDVAERLKTTADELKELMAKRGHFPFLASLENTAEKVSSLSKQSYRYFFSEIEDYADELLDQKEDLLDPIRQFMSGSMAEIYADARDVLVQNRDNLDYVGKDVSEQIRTALDDARCFAGQQMQAVKADLDQLKEEIRTTVEREQQEAIDLVDSRRQQLEALLEYAANESLDDEVQAEIQQTVQKIRHAGIIAVVRDLKRRFDEDVYPRLLQQVTSPLKPSTSGDGGPQESDPTPQPTFVSIRSLRVEYSQPILTDSMDVENYVAALQAAMLAELDAGNRIRV